MRGILPGVLFITNIALLRHDSLITFCVKGLKRRKLSYNSERKHTDNR